MKVARDMIDPQLRLMGRLVHLMVAGGLDDVETVRRRAEKPGIKGRVLDLLETVAAPTPKGVSVEERWIPRPSGPDMRILIRRPVEPREGVPGILHLHGGGYHSGRPESALHAGAYIRISGCVIVSPAYRRSVEAPYPAALEDSYTALLWLRDNAAALGVRDDQLVVTGESAGGGLTAATTLYARDRGEVNVAFQMPLFPMIDDRNDSHSARDNDAPIWNAATNEVGWRLYLGELWGTDDVPAYAAPARATDHAGLPPTYTYVGGVDPFRTETETYVANLRAAGVPAELDVHEGAFHGFDGAKHARITKEAHRRLHEWFARAVEEYTAKQPELGDDRPAAETP